MTDQGIHRFGAYIPRLRLERAAIAAAHRWMAPSLKGLAKGTRAFCSWDEDAVTMAVEAARDCLPRDARAAVEGLTLASTTLPYADLQSSGIVAGALALPAAAALADVGGSQRAGLSALIAALRDGSRRSQLVVGADRLVAKPASTQEMAYGAGAAAFHVGGSGGGDPIARFLGAGVHNAPFIDHFRPAGADHDYFWEERWIRDEGLAKLVPPAVDAALAEAKLTIADVDTLVFASSLKGAATALAKQLKFAGTVLDSLDDGCGYAGVAHPLLLLSLALESAKPGQRIFVAAFGQGAEALIVETTPAIADAGRAPRRGVRGSLAAGIATSDYLRLASFYGAIEPEWGMRAEKTGKAALTTQYRESHQLASFVAGKCGRCATVQFPRLAYCVNPECVAPASHFRDAPLTEEPAKVLTFTADWLSYHPAPPLYVGFVQFDVGARLLMEIADVGAGGTGGIEVGTPLEIVYRIKEPDRTRGFNRYFWKATPIAGARAAAKEVT